MSEPKKKTGDLFINNAGVLTSETLFNLDFDRMRRQFDVNALGPLRVMQALRPSLNEGSKVAIITSRVGAMADNRSSGYYAGCREFGSGASNAVMNWTELREMEHPDKEKDR